MRQRIRLSGTVRFLVVGLGSALCVSTAGAEMRLCSNGAGRINASLAQIEAIADPCGQSPMRTLLQALRNCPKAIYDICTDTTLNRNIFERPSEFEDQSRPRTISWNPDLQSELELGCDGESDRPVFRDPTASLLHEIVHAVQDCEGLNPGEHEMEAVAIENIYRRSVGLCQRSRYGDQLLPPDTWQLCTLNECTCSTPITPMVLEAQLLRSTARTGATPEGATGDLPP